MELINLERTGSGKYLKEYNLTYINNQGKRKVYEMCSHNDIHSPEEIASKVSGFSICGFYEGKMLILKEFRMGVNREIYNLCAGFSETGETLEEGIRRELYEETGLEVDKIIDILPPCFAAVAISDIKNRIVFVTLKGKIENHNLPNEQIKAFLYDKEEVARLIETEDFASRAQLCGYLYSRGFLDELIKKTDI